MNLIWAATGSSTAISGTFFCRRNGTDMPSALSCQAENESKIVLKCKQPQVFRLRLFQTYSIFSSVSASISSGSSISSQSSKDCLEIRIMFLMWMILNAPRFCQLIGWWTSDTKNGSYIIYSIGPILRSLLFVWCTHNDLQSIPAFFTIPSMKCWWYKASHAGSLLIIC